jgi:mRNA interferase MazF
LSNLLIYGGIYLANLNPQRKQAAAEVSKTRPVLVMQSPGLLAVNHPTTIILPLTTQLKDQTALRFRVLAQGNLKQDSDIILDQIRAIDNQRLHPNSALCVLDTTTMGQIYKALLDILMP